MLSKALLGFSVPDNQPSMAAHYNPNHTHISLTGFKGAMRLGPVVGWVAERGAPVELDGAAYHEKYAPFTILSPL